MFRNAAAFNQPLSFDTSSVTTMGLMFGVRSTRLPYMPSTSAVGPHTLHTLRAPNVFYNTSFMFNVPVALSPICSRALPHTLRVPPRLPAGTPRPAPHAPV